jgi:hypothetical protein
MMAMLALRGKILLYKITVDPENMHVHVRDHHDEPSNFAVPENNKQTHVTGQTWFDLGELSTNSCHMLPST